MTCALEDFLRLRETEEPVGAFLCAIVTLRFYCLLRTHCSQAKLSGFASTGGGWSGSQVKVLESPEEFDALLAKTQNRKMVVVKFFASWCRKCLAMKPKYERLAVAYGSVSGGASCVDCSFLLFVHVVTRLP